MEQAQRGNAGVMYRAADHARPSDDVPQQGEIASLLREQVQRRALNPRIKVTEGLSGRCRRLLRLNCCTTSR